MDRRNFLKLFAASSAVAIFDHATYGIDKTNGWVFAEQGIKFTAPLGWEILNARDILGLKGTQVFEEVDDASEAESFTPTPVVAFTKYREPTPKANPSILVFIDKAPEWIATHTVETLSLFEDDYSRLVKNHKFHTHAQTASIGNIIGARSEVSFLFEEVNGNDCLIRRESNIMCKGNYVFMMILTDAPEHLEQAQTEFNTFKKSIEFENG